MILADSMRQTASMARWVVVDVTASHHTTFEGPMQDQGVEVFVSPEDLYVRGPCEFCKCCV